MPSDWLVSDCKGVVACLHALRAGRQRPKGRHRDLERRAVAAFWAGLQIVWMRAHQSDKDAEEGRVQHSDLQGNRTADVAANNGTREHVPCEPSEEWKQWGSVCQAARNVWLSVGSKLRNRPERWPRVRLPAPEPVPDLVVPVEVTNLLVAPFVVWPPQRVVEHATYAICLDCNSNVGIHIGRQNITHHACKGKLCQPLKRKKRAGLDPGVGDTVHSAASGRAKPHLAGIG
eukprot:215807-Amphidinium_carterae.2